jgi:hypothetical protein
VNKYEQIIKQIIETNPSWEKDGGGIRGRTLAPLIGGASGPNLMGDPIPQQFNRQRNELVQQQDDPVPKLNLPAIGGEDGESCIGLNLYTKTVGNPPNTTQQVWVGAGTVAGQLPSGFDPSEGKNIANSGSGDVWAEVNINGNTGEIVSVEVDGGSATPNNTNSSFYYTLGFYKYENGNPSVVNYGCGSVTVAICRNWFATNPPFYTVTFFRD